MSRTSIHNSLVIIVTLLIAFGAVTYLQKGARVVQTAHVASVTAGHIQDQSGTLPDVSFKDMNGKDVTLAAFKGQVLLVNIWATWCPPCVAELPSLDILQKKLESKGLKIIAISVDTAADHKTLQEFFDAHDIEKLEPYHDNARALPSKWKYAGVPTSYLIARDGNIIKRFEGGFDWAAGEAFDVVAKAVE